jgi:hypothetical protein
VFWVFNEFDKFSGELAEAIFQFCTATDPLILAMSPEVFFIYAWANVYSPILLVIIQIVLSVVAIMAMEHDIIHMVTIWSPKTSLEY